MGRLRDKFLNVSLNAVLHPASLSAQRAAEDQKAAALTAPAVQVEELTATEWFERGFNAMDPDEKLRCYGQAIRLKPDYAEAFNNRGNARNGKGDLEGALQDYNEALRLKPDLAEAFYNRGLALEGKGDIKGAIANFLKYLDLGGGVRDGDVEVEQKIQDLRKSLSSTRMIR
jgi:tetratricopeptide (TPR) repeat protein